MEAAGKAFRRHGLSGIGVDGLAKGANLTSGAFYFHFPSKLTAFAAAVRAGLEDLREGIAAFQADHGKGWLQAFTAFYMGNRRTCELGDGCALPSLSAEVERAGDEVRSAYEEELRLVAATMAEELEPTSLTQQEQAWALLAMLSGGVNLARAVQDPVLSEEIASAVQKAAGALTESAGQSRISVP